MKEDKVIVGKYNESKIGSDPSDIIFPINPDFERDDLMLIMKRLSMTKSVKAGAFTGAATGIILVICFSVLILINAIYTYQPGGTLEEALFYAVASFFMLPLIGMCAGIPVGSLFGLGFALSRRHKTQFHKRLVRDWTAAWTLIFCTVFTIVVVSSTSWGLFPLLVTFGSLLPISLIGGYLGGELFDLFEG